MSNNAEIKNRIAQVLSEILSDKYDCVVKLRFVERGQDDEAEQTTDRAAKTSA